MSGSCFNSPCGACKFLRRRCIKECVFAPYFSHEEGASNFAVIHKVFGASNAFKLLSNLPTIHRDQAAITIYFEAQARLQNPIYGCVSHIYTLQQQVMHLQAELEILKQEEAIQSMGICNSPLIESFNYEDIKCQNDQTTLLNYLTGSYETVLQNYETSWFYGAGGDITPTMNNKEYYELDQQVNSYN